VRRSTAYAALVGFGLSVVMNLATFGGANLMWPNLMWPIVCLLLLLGMGMAAVGGLLSLPSWWSYDSFGSWLETGRKSPFEIWTEREGLALLHVHARSNEELDEAEWVRVLRPRRAAIALFVLGLYVVVNIVAIEVLLRGGSLEQDALGYFLRAEGGGFIARLSESEGAWIQVSLARLVTSITMFVFFWANCVWRIPPSPRAEIAQGARTS
jgi:hypothetical protein